MRLQFLILIFLVSHMCPLPAFARESSIQRPTAETPADTARDLCRDLSRRALSDGVKVLVIGFEGLASYSAPAVAQAYETLDAIHSGDNIRANVNFSSGGYLTNGLVIPMLEKNSDKMELLLFPNDAVGNEEGSVPEICARIWVNEGTSRKLVLLGHSYGGHAAYQLASLLEQGNVSVAAVFTMDPRTKLTNTVTWSRPQSVRLWNNFYQRNFGSLPGYPIENATANVDLSSTGVSHLSIPSSPAVLNAVNRFFAR